MTWKPTISFASTFKAPKGKLKKKYDIACCVLTVSRALPPLVTVHLSAAPLSHGIYAVYSNNRGRFNRALNSAGLSYCSVVPV